MAPGKKMNCWEIMQCKETENCAAREYPDTPCWELSEKLGIDQSIMDVCDDCIVHLMKTNNTKLTPQEIDDIIKYRKSAKQTENCPIFNNPAEQNQSEKKKAHMK